MISYPRKSPRYSVMAAVSIDGVVETMTCAVPPSYTALDYALFMHALATSMGKWNPDLPSDEWKTQITAPSSSSTMPQSTPMRPTTLRVSKASWCSGFLPTGWIFPQWRASSPS